MKILGIDPGLNICGYAVIEKNSASISLTEAGFFKTKRTDTLEKRLNQIAEDINDIIKNHKPDIAAVEELYSHYAHPKTAILMGHARGVILQSAANSGMLVKSFAATKVKKAITGHGRASKMQMQMTIKAMLKLKNIPEPNDVADAISIALCCANTI